MIGLAAFALATRFSYDSIADPSALAQVWPGLIGTPRQVIAGDAPSVNGYSAISNPATIRAIWAIRDLTARGPEG